MCLRHGWHRPPSPNAETNTNKSSFCWDFFSRDMSFPAPESWQKTLFWTESHWAGWFIFLYVAGKREEMIQPERQLCFKRSWRVSQRPNPPWKLYIRGHLCAVCLFVLTCSSAGRWYVAEVRWPGQQMPLSSFGWPWVNKLSWRSQVRLRWSEVALLRMLKWSPQ